MKNELHPNWCMLLDELARCKTFYFEAFRKRAKVDASLITTMIVAGYAKHINGQAYNWIGPLVLSEEEKIEFCNLHRQRCRDYKAKRNAAAQRAVPLKPVQKQNIQSTHTTSNSIHSAIELLKQNGYEIYRVQKVQL